MKVLVTGATGFIGNHVINELLKSDGVHIITTSRDREKAKIFSWFDQVEYISYDFDVVEDINLYKYFGKPDKVIHLAWGGLPNYNGLFHIEKNLLSHYSFVKNMIENGLKDITITGTCFEYGMVNGCLSEGMDTKPSNSYAIAKDSLRRFVVELKKNFDFDYRWIRLFYMYGEGQSSKSLLSLLDKAIENGDKEFNMSRGEQLRDFLHVSDVAKNILSISNQNIYTNEVINCCSGEPISIRRLVENYLQEKKYEMKLNLGFYPYPDYEPMAFWGDNLKLKFLKGFNK